MKITSKNFLFCIASGSFLFFSCHKSNNNGNQTVSTQDSTFILKAALSNTAEVQAGQLASTVADSSSVQMFAQKMVTDHTTAQNDLKTVGQNDNVAVPDSVDAMHAMLMDTLKMLSGRAFDSVYVMNQIMDHQKTISDFQQEVNSGNKTDVVNYANKNLPILQMHLQMADSLATVMKFK
jgi:putative membrane protein